MYKKLIVILIAGLFIGVGFLPIITTNVQADITTGLVAYWNFNEGNGNILYDQTAYNNDGTISGADWVSGIEGSALKFTSSSDIVTGIPSSWDNNIGNAFTIASWIKWDGPSGLYYIIFDGRDDELDMAGFCLFIDNSKLNIHWYESGSYVSSNSNIPIGEWTHVAVVFNGDSNYFKIYIDGVLDKTDSTTATYRDSNHYAAIGNNHWAPSDGNWRPFNGVIDELRIYNRVLIHSDINELYDIGNNPPNKPSTPSGPASGLVSTLIDFSTSTTDPDNDQIQYGWDWNGDSLIDEWSGLHPSGNTCYKAHQWDKPGTYSFKVKAKDSKGAVSDWSGFKTIEIYKNQPPMTPSNPNPPNHTIDVDININLSWSGGDPDIDDTVTYDIYFGSMLPIPKVASNITTTVYDPGVLVNSLTYFWSIVAWDNHDVSTVGPGWDFTTIKANDPPNKPSKPVGQIKGTKGITYFYTSNTTDPDGDQIYYLWDWGDDSFSEWLGPYESGLLTNVSHSWSEGSYSIRVKSKDIYDLESYWSEPLEISMPKSYIDNSIIQFIMKMLERFPFFEKILNLDY